MNYSKVNHEPVGIQIPNGDVVLDHEAMPSIILDDFATPAKAQEDEFLTKLDTNRQLQSNSPTPAET
jgi:hypothetical protein